MAVAWALGLMAASYVGGGQVLVSAAAFAPLVVAAYVDSVCHLLPDPLLLVAGAVALTGAAADGTLAAANLWAAAFGLIAGYLAGLVSTLGQGDAKLLGVLGLWLGPTVVTAVVLAVVGAGVYSLVLMMARRATWATSIALGPWLVAGAGIAFALGTA